MRGEITKEEALNRQDVDHSFSLLDPRPIVECPRCRYVGESAGTSLDLLDLVTLVPPAGHFIGILFRGRREGNGLRCAMCDYEDPVVLSEEAARTRMGHARYQYYVEQRRKGVHLGIRRTTLFVIMLGVLAYILLRVWEFHHLARR